MRTGFKHFYGFTLAELLISLAILGIIATFTIPKVLQNQANSKYNAMAKEVMGMISGAYQTYKISNTPTASFSISNLTPYMNYLRIDSSTTIDDNPGDSNGLPCSDPTWQCLRLHDGGIILFPAAGAYGFGGTASTNGTFIQFDPDGLNLNPSSADGPGKGLEFWLYANGGIRTTQDLLTNTCNSNWCINAIPNSNPGWFSWN